MDLLAFIAFAGLIAGQFSAVIAVHAFRNDEEAAHLDRRPAHSRGQRKPAVPASGTRALPR